MEGSRSRTFWDVAFTPDRDFIIVFISMILVTTLFGNFVYSVLTDLDSLTLEETLATVAVMIVLLLIAGYIWSGRKTRYLPFRVREGDELQPAQAVIAIPSNTGTIGKIMRYHGATLKHLWLVGDPAMKFDDCDRLFGESGVKLHRVVIGQTEGVGNTFEGYNHAFEQATGLDIPSDQIVVDITGGKKPMSIQAFLLALEQGLTISYVESNYTIVEGEESISRVNDEVFTIVRFDTSVIPSTSLYGLSGEESAAD